MWAAPQGGTNTTDWHLVWTSVGGKGWAGACGKVERFQQTGSSERRVH
jgi:hypothetical protein